MSWTLLLALTAILAVTLLALWSRRGELDRMEETVAARDRARSAGSDRAQLQHPVIDLSRCLGCATCVAVCPEDGVLDLVHGQAMVVNGTRCQGISACERECPAGAITVTLTDVENRRDIPALSEGLEAIGSDGLFLAGEVTAKALIKTATTHGAAVAAEVARRVADTPADDELLDLLIVGAGPAGLACSLEARRQGLSFATLEQEAGPGGTVAKYPRKKLVMTQPLELPIYGRSRRTTYEKEELVDLWQRMTAEQDLPILGGQKLAGLERDGRGHYVVRTETDTFHARHVCLAIGRRGSPRKLGVPGEELDKVTYSLIDARSYQGRRVLVVGGGDSAVEAALGLAEQPGNEVTLSYRQEHFFRIRMRNEERLRAAVAEGRVRVVLRSRVTAIRPDRVELEVLGPNGSSPAALPNDEVFVLAGGEPPFELLERAGVSFDPRLRPVAEVPREKGSGLRQALVAALALTLATLLFAVWNSDYYLLPEAQRPAHDKHELLHPSKGLALWMGVVTCALIVVNLAYLVRRASGSFLRLGSLKAWMTSHVVTGILALLFALLHAAMAPGDTPGGHAFWALVVLMVTGAIGRWFYAWVPRAANGRELELAEVKTRLGRLEGEWDRGQQGFRERARERIVELVEKRQWRTSFAGRLWALVGVPLGLQSTLRALDVEGRAEGVPEEQLGEIRQLARRAHRTALMASHYEDLRALLATWRWLHRWVAALMLLLVIIHVVTSLTYGTLDFETGLE